MKNILFRRYVGFSLAEAMITILIIGIIALLSVPIAKKMVKKDKNPNKGMWMATRCGGGQAVYWTKGMANKDNPCKWTKCNTTCEVNGKTYYDCCVFDSPLNVRNFSLEAVGGGGGGATATKMLKTYTGNTTYRLEAPGEYRMVAIGAGGAGGMSECDKSGSHFLQAGGGGAGGAGYATVYMGDDTTKFELNEGYGVNNTSTKGGGSKGGDSYIRRYTVGNNYKNIIYAEGGNGGEGFWHNCNSYTNNNHNGGRGTGGSNGNVRFEDSSYIEKGTYKTENAKTRCSSYNGYSRVICYGYVNDRTAFNDYLKENISSSDFSYGRGGNTGSSKKKDWIGNFTYYDDRTESTRSKDGFVTAVTYLLRAGTGGHAAVYFSEHIPKFDTNKVIVVIGRGGSSGMSNASFTTPETQNGKDGENTYVGSKIYPGGKGGVYKSLTASKSTPGGNGEPTTMPSRTAPTVIYGGLADKDGNLDENSDSVNGENAVGYGAGGGGAGILVKDFHDVVTGRGGNGAPGYVKISW